MTTDFHALADIITNAVPDRTVEGQFTSIDLVGFEAFLARATPEQLDVALREWRTINDRLSVALREKRYRDCVALTPPPAPAPIYIITRPGPGHDIVVRIFSGDPNVPATWADEPVPFRPTSTGRLYGPLLPVTP